MAWSFTSDKPVYLQIANRITASVLSGEYKAGVGEDRPDARAEVERRDARDRRPPHREGTGGHKGMAAQVLSVGDEAIRSDLPRRA